MGLLGVGGLRCQVWVAGAMEGGTMESLGLDLQVIGAKVPQFEGWGNWRSRGIDRRRRPPIGKSVSVSFHVVSCVRASGRGEAVPACERGVFVNAGPYNSEMFTSGRGLVFRVFAAICIGVMLFSLRSLLFVLAFWFFCVLVVI